MRSLSPIRSTSGLDVTSIIELEEFVAQFLAFGVAKLVASVTVFGSNHSARRGLLNSLLLRFHVRKAATALRGGQVGRRGQHTFLSSAMQRLMRPSESAYPLERATAPAERIVCLLADQKVTSRSP